MPEVCIGDDKAWLRVEDGMGLAIWIEQLVEVGVSRIHARGADPFDPLLGQGRGECAAAFAEALELLVFVRADEVAHDLAVAGWGRG